jgi:hypothetical protein
MSSEGWKVALTNCQYVQGARVWAPVHELGRDRSGGPTPDTGNNVTAVVADCKCLKILLSHFTGDDGFLNHFLTHRRV